MSEVWEKYGTVSYLWTYAKITSLLSSVVDPKLFISDPDPDPTLTLISDPDPNSDPDPACL